MPWFAGVIVIVSVVLGVQTSVLGSESATERGRWVSNLEIRPRAEAARLPKVAQQVESPQNSYRYDAGGRRDPFESLVKETPPLVQPGPVIEPARVRGPLERFDLSSLTLSGIVWGGLGRRAIIRAPDGKGYFVTVGMYMGQNGGQIVAIEDDRVVITEKHRDVKGKIFEKTLTIPLRPKEKQQG
jgi:Tfp pilus assembly protein PilP